MPKRIQMTRQTPWRADNPDAVIVARSARGLGAWGNPYRVGDTHEWITTDRLGSIFHSRVITRELAVELYRRDIIDEVVGAPSVETIRRELRGRDLACWCPVDGPCHGDVLLEVANSLSRDELIDTVDWIERRTDETFIYEWRTPAGLHYLDATPRSGEDVAISRAKQTTLVGVALGDHPTLGWIRSTGHGDPLTTIVEISTLGPSEAI